MTQKIVSLEGSRDKSSRPTRQDGGGVPPGPTEPVTLFEPFSRALSREEFHGTSEKDSLKPQFSMRLSAVNGNLGIRRWLAGTAILPGVPDGRWFMTDDLPPGIYIEDPFDVRLFHRRWSKYFNYDPQVEDHNELVLARRFFSAAGLPPLQSRRATRRAFEKTAPVRSPCSLGESVVNDDRKVRLLYRMWKGLDFAS